MGLCKWGFQFLVLAFLTLAIHTLTSCAPQSAESTTMRPDTTLPFGLFLDPDADFKGGFTIRESDGFALIGKGVTYRDIDLTVAMLIGYGVQKEALAAEVLDEQGNTKFIKVLKQLSPSKQPFSVSWATEDVKNNGNYTWVSLADNE